MKFPEYLSDWINNDEDLVEVADSIFGSTKRIEEQKKDAENKQQTLLVISGLSGSGKDSIVTTLINTNKRFGLIKTCTTRARRPEESEEDDPHIRLTDEAFQNALACGDVVEWTEYAGHRYCSLTSVCEKSFDLFDVPILRVDPAGSRHYLDMWRKKEWLFNKVNLVYAFVVTPSVEVLRERLLLRSGDEQFVESRISQMRMDMPYINDAEYILVNETGKLESVANELSNLIFV